MTLRADARRCVTMRDDACRRVRRQFGSGVHLEDRLLPSGARFVVWQRPASFVDIAVRRLAYPRCTGYCSVAHHTAFVSTADVQLFCTVRGARKQWSPSICEKFLSVT